MKYRRVGKTDIEVSAVAMGCWAIVDDETWGPQSEDDAVAAILASLDAGVTLFDTAEGYGNGGSERLLGRVLRPHRRRAVIATKASRRNMSAGDLVRACEDSLRRLQTETIDIYQLHWPSRDVPFDETASALEGLVRDGKIRAAGVSNFGPLDLAEFAEVTRPATDQIAYNLLFRAAEYELLDACSRNDVSILCYSPLAEGLLTGKFGSAEEVPAGRARTRHFNGSRPFARHAEDGAESEVFEAVGRVKVIAGRLGLPMGQLALAWLLRRRPVASVLAGARSASQARENAAAADVELSDDVVAELAEVAETVKEKLGPNLDPWQTESRIR